MTELTSRKAVLALPWEFIASGKLPGHSKKVAGVYMLKDKNTKHVVYVGKSTNIGHRLLVHHFNHRFDRGVHDLYIMCVNDEESRQYIEARSIAWLQPELNKRNGHLIMTDAELQDGYTNIFNR